MNYSRVPTYTPKNQKNRNIKNNLFVFLLFVVLLLSFIIVFGFSLNNQLGLVKHNITVSNLNKSLEGFTILHISDLNGDSLDLEEMGTLLKGNNYSAVCLTGNMIGKKGNAEPLFRLIDMLQKINSKAPIYFITGNFDPDPILFEPHGDNEVLAGYILELQKLGVIYLDRPILQQIGKYNIWFSPEYLYNIDPKSTLNAMTNEIKRMEESGTQYEASGAAIYRSLSYKSRVMEESILALDNINENDIQVVLSNTPLSEGYISSSIQYNDEDKPFKISKVNLILSGYFVGGQWNLPGGTPIYVPDYGFFPNKEKIYGLSRLLTVNQYISPGLSTSGIYPYPSFRLFNQPSIALLKLTSRYK